MCAVAPRLALALTFVFGGCGGAVDERSPNVVLIVADDLGFGDPGSFGGDPRDTPHLGRMASQGMRLTRFYMPTAACSPSRAALLTGRYPIAVGIPGVLAPRSTTGLDSSVVTVAELFRAGGYATAVVGKWHLGSHPDFFPVRHGFDRWFGIPYSNDMSPDPANNPRERARRHPPLPLVRDTTIVEREPDQRTLTVRYTDEAVGFIREHRDTPFFLYFAHKDPHVPLFPDPATAGESPNGAYGDVVRDIDRSTGRILDALRETGNHRRTLVLFTSDNGPWLVMGNHAGSAGGLREGKATAFEGGHRVPALAWWPGKIPSGSESAAFLSALDILPTFAAVAGLPWPADLRVDGVDRWDIFAGRVDTVADGAPFLYYRAGQLHAVRRGRWKLHVEHTYPSMVGGMPGRDGMPGTTVTRSIGPALFDLLADPGETIDVAADHPAIVEALMGDAAEGRALYGDRKTSVVGRLATEPGRVDRPWTDLLVAPDSTGGDVP